MTDNSSVIVEFFGVPRQRAGRAELTVRAGTLAQIAAEIERHCPGLKGLVTAEGRLAKHLLLSLDGEQFVADLGKELPPGARLLLLSADAGG